MPSNIAHRVQGELERTVKRLQAFCATKMDLPLLNPYGLPLKITRVELFSFLILRACCD